MSIASVMGLTPFIISFSLFYLVSFKVVFQLIPSLFEFNVPLIDYKGLGLDHPYSEELKPKLNNPYQSIGDNLQLNSLVQHIFSFNLASVFLLIELSLFEIESYFNADSRLMIWHILIPITAISLAFVIPVMIVLILVNRFLPRMNKSLTLALVGLALVSWLYFLSELDVMTGINTDKLKHNMISKYVSELTLLGITAIAMLGGVGMISNPFYELLKKDEKVTKFDIEKIVSNLKTTNQILKLRQEEIDNYQKQGVHANNKELKLLEEEVNAILQLKNSINSDLINATNVYDIQKNHPKLSFKVSKLVKKLFSIYCLYRLISLFLIKLPKMFFHKLFHEQDIAQDALAITISKIILQLRASDNIEEGALVNQLSFILSGFLFLCSISSVVNTFHSASKMIPHSIKLSSHFKNQDKRRTSILRSLLLSELVGMYTLLTITLLRSNLPDELSSNFDSAIGGEPLQVKFVTDWFDKVSITSCFLTIIGISIDEFLNHGEYDEDFYIDEENFVQNDKIA